MRTISRQSKQFALRRRKRLVVRIAVVIGILVFLVGGASLVSSASFFRINQIVISGIDDSTTSSIHALVLGALDGTYGALFPRNNVLIYPHSDIEYELKDAYKEIEEVTISRVDRHTLKIALQEKQPTVLVCPTLPDFVDNDISTDDPNSCYFADANGLIFKKSPSFSGSVYRRYYVPGLVVLNEGSESLVGVFATSSTDFVRVDALYEFVVDHGITVDALLIKEDGEYELFIRNPDGKTTAVVYLSNKSSLEEQVANLISFWDHTVSEIRTTRNTMQFEYIDVRYGSNVYHRLVSP